MIIRYTNRTRRILFVVSLGLLVGVFFTLSILSRIDNSKSTVDSQTAAIVESREEVEGLIRERGGAAAYEEIKKQSSRLSIFDKHGMGHRFGEILYSVEGVGGVRVCDAELSFGCFHSFTIAAIYNKGIDVAREIDSICIDKYGLLGHGCTHGIGHGLIEYFGATDEGLNQSLEVCGSLTYKGTIMGCQNGVFMEFNHPSPTANGEKRSSREFLETNPNYPCDIVDKRFIHACYYEQGKWVHRLTGSFERALDYCIHLSPQSHKEACLRGVGSNVAEDNNFDSSQAFQRCSYISYNSGLIHCVGGSEYMIRAVYPSKTPEELPCFLTKMPEKCRESADSIVD